MKSTYSIIFYLKREKLKKDGTYPVMGRITVDGTQCQFSCKVDCKPDLWETKGGRATGKSVMARNVNMELDKIKARIDKYYKAEVLGEFEQKEGVLEDMIYKDGKTNMSFRVDEKDPRYKDAKKAVLEYKEVSPGSLEIKLITGRHHQIRVQLANAGHPILGDTKYGSVASKDETAKRGIRELKLKAYKLQINHPKTGESMEFTIPEE